MRISCESGYYKFYPDSAPAAKTLERVFNIEVVQEKNYYTFQALKDMPAYSIIGKIIGLGICFLNFSNGNKADVLKKNLLTYNLSAKNITSLLVAINVPAVRKSNYYAFNSIPQAGGIVDGQPFNSFFGEIDLTLGMVKVERFSYDL